MKTETVKRIRRFLYAGEAQELCMLLLWLGCFLLGIFSPDRHPYIVGAVVISVIICKGQK